MKHGSFNYVRTYRQRHGLSSDELAALIDQRGRAAIPQFEAGDRIPTLIAALALQVVFGLAPREMFPDLYARIEDAVMRRAAELYESLGALTDRYTEAKRDLLNEMPRRALANGDPA
jgi:transcriptional regulator with XRE-family HTH domain